MIEQKHDWSVEHEQPSNVKLALAGLAMVVVLAVCGGVLSTIFYQTVDAEIYQKVLSRPSPELDALRAKEEQTLSTYGWVDQKKGQARMPIDQAMKLVVQESPK